MLEICHQMLVFCFRHVFRGRVLGHEFVEDRHGYCSTGFVEKDASDEKVEGIVRQTFLRETK